MRKIISTLILIMTLSLSAQAEISGFWGLKAEVWEALKEHHKYWYVLGVFDGLVFAKLEMHGVEISTDLSVEQYVDAIDEFYSDYRNALIPAAFVLKIVTLEINGSEKDKVEAEIIKLRKVISAVTGTVEGR